MRNFLSDLYQPIAQFASQFDSPTAEAVKSTLRLFFLMAVSWLLVQLLTQINLVPEYQYLKVWVFMLNVPMRAVLFFLLTAVSKYVDKLLFEMNSNTRKKAGEVSTGLAPF